jgi:hypothetical protein
VIVKEAIPQDSQDFEFTLAGQAFSTSLSLDDDGDATNGLSNVTQLLAVPGSYTAVQADAGPAWDTTSIVCTNAAGASVGDVDLSALTATVELPAGATITCVFTDVKRGTIVVRKVVEIPTGTTWDPTSIGFEFDSDYAGLFLLTHGESLESGLLPARTDYTVAENVPRAWVVRNECVYPDGSVVDGGSSARVTLPPGSEVLCTFFNEMRIHPGSSGFWRNWTNHYDVTQFETILTDALSDSPVYASLFDPLSRELLPGALEVIEELYDFGGSSTTTQQKLLTEMTSHLSRVQAGSR